MVVPLHFFVCDAGGECMVVEPDGDRLAVIAGKKLAVPIVANRAWREDYRDAKAHAESMWERLTTPGFQSHARYSTIYQALRGKERMSRPEVFETLEDARISQINRWQIVWNQDRGQATYRIRDDDADGTFRRLSLDKMDFRCTEDIRVQELKVSSSPWRDFAVADRAVIEVRVKQLVAVRSGRVPRGFAAAVAEHTQTSRCARKTAGR